MNSRHVFIGGRAFSLISILSVSFHTIICALIALLAPKNVVDIFPFIGSVFEFWASYIPNLHARKAISAFPQVTVFFYSVAWTLFIFQLIACFIFYYQRFDHEYLFSNFKGSKLKLVSIFLAAILLTSFHIFFSKTDPQIAGKFAISISRIGLAFFGSIAYLFFSLSASALFFVLFFTKSRDF